MAYYSICFIFPVKNNLLYVPVPGVPTMYSTNYIPLISTIVY